MPGFDEREKCGMNCPMEVSYSSDNEAVWSEERKLLTRERLHIPGLHLIGHANFRNTLETLEPHRHRSMEFVAVIKGRQQYVTQEQKYTLHGGDVFMTFPEEVHGNGSFPQEICEFVWFQIDLSSEENFLGLTVPHSKYLYQQLQNYRFRIVHASQNDLQKLRKAFYLLSAEDMQSKLLGYSYFLEFVVHNLVPGAKELKTGNIIGGEFSDRNHNEEHPAFYDQKTASEKSDSIDFSEAVGYIHAHLTENPTLESIAEYCGMSPSRFNAGFKEQVGITPHAYITNLKIDTARILLKNPENTVTDVAYQLNFSSGNHFSSVFKKYTGYTPTQYRQQKYTDI